MRLTWRASQYTRVCLTCLRPYTEIMTPYEHLTVSPECALCELKRRGWVKT